MVLAFVFLALAGFLAVVGIVLEPFVLIVALMFGVVAYFMWYQASGRLGRRLYRRVETRARANNGQRRSKRQRQRQKQRQKREQRQNARGGFGAGPREDWNPRSEWARGDGFSTDQRQQHRRRTSATGTRMDPTTAQAYDILGLDPDADEATIKRAYRERVKDVHPDTESGSEEEFKRVNNAYERLTEN
jgi:hypothetical protein